MHIDQALARPRAAIFAAMRRCALAALHNMLGRGRMARAARVGIVLSIVSFGWIAGAAHALPLRFNFAVDFTSGPLDGQTAFGSFEVSSDDCPSLVCSGAFTPLGPANPIIGPTGTLLAFEITVDGVTFLAGDDDVFPEFPSVELLDNVLTRIDFADLGGPTSLSIFGSLLGGWGGEYKNASFDASTVGNVRQIGGAQLLPEPATALLVAGALLTCVPATRRRRLR